MVFLGSEHLCRTPKDKRKPRGGSVRASLENSIQSAISPHQQGNVAKTMTTKGRLGWGVF